MKPTTRFGIFTAAAIGLTTLMARQASAEIFPLSSGTVTTTSTGSPNTYALTLSDASNSPGPITSVWAAWTPGHFFMTATPTSVTSPTGWSSQLVSTSIQWTANSSAFDIPAGSSLSGFGFSSTESPASIDGTTGGGTPVLTSVAYDDVAIGDGTGTTFAFTPTAVPEPASLAMLTPMVLLLLRRTRRSLTAIKPLR